jgi:spectrin beta
MVESEKLCNKYEKSINELLKWIQKKTKELGDFAFPNSLDGIRLLTLKFNKEYMTLEKPPKYTEKSEIEALFYSINMSLNSKGHPKYGAPEGKALHDLESAWNKLEKAERARDSALKKELNRQEQLEQMYLKFDKKVLETKS